MPIKSNTTGHNIIDSDISFVIDPFTRVISSESPQKDILIQGDHNAERFTFTMPRYIEGHDMSLCNSVQVHYLNIENNKKNNQFATGVKMLNDLHICEDDSSKIRCTWLITRNATHFAGLLHFMLQFSCMTDEVIDYRWRTLSYDKIYVGESINADLSFEAEYVDIIEQWKQSVTTYLEGYVKTNVDEVVAVAKQELDEELHITIDQYFTTQSEHVNKTLSAFDAILKTDVTNMSNEIEILKARMNAFTALGEGSTTGDAEVIDIRIGANGEEYENAGTAVREQFSILNGLSEEDNPFNLFKFVERRYYRGGSVVGTYKQMKPTTKLLDINTFLVTEDAGESNLYACSATLAKPIDVFGVGEGNYVLILDSDIDDTVTVRFSSDIHWGETATSVATSQIKVSKGINVIKLDFVGVVDAGHDKYTNLSLQSSNLPKATKYDVYIASSSAITEYVTNELDMIKKGLIVSDIDNKIELVTKNLDNVEVTYENSLLTVTIPEKETEEPEWRFAMVSINLGTDISGKKLLVRRNTNNIRSFGIGVNYAQWANKHFSINHDIELIDLEEFISDNDALANNTGYYFLIVGIEPGTNITHNGQYVESVNIMEVTGSIDSISPIARLLAFDPSKYLTADELPKIEKKIICWGDSLTAQGLWTDKLASLSGLEVINCGTGGENSNTIASRQGADCIMINNVIIPADTTPVQLTNYATKFTTYMGSVSAPLLQGGSSHVNPCMLGDVEGTLKWTGSTYDDTNGVWTFTRSVAGKEVKITRPTQLTTFADREYSNSHYKNNIHVFFIGTNDGAFNADDMIAKIRLMIEHSKAHEYIVMGLTRIQTTDYKAKFKAAFGRRWIDLHGYLVAYGLEDSGIEATNEDLTAIASNKVPPSLLLDAVHYTETTRNLIGIQVYNRMRDLGYFE